MCACPGREHRTSWCPKCDGAIPSTPDFLARLDIIDATAPDNDAHDAMTTALLGMPQRWEGDDL